MDKALLREKFIELNACIRKEEIFEINDFKFYLKILENEQIKFKLRTVNKNLRTQINKIEHRKIIENSMKQKLVKKINKINKWLVRLLRKKRKKAQIYQYQECYR